MDKTIIKFWANGCGNCKAMEPIMAQLKSEFPNITFKDANTADVPDDVEKYEISSLPTLVFLRDGAFADKMVGLKPKSLISKKILEIFG